MKKLVVQIVPMQTCKHTVMRQSIQETVCPDSDDNQAISFLLLCTMEQTEKCSQVLADPVDRIWNLSISLCKEENL